MRDTLITVAVPIYNVERYLSKCIRSIANQSYKNLQIILVDDGSKDQSLEICNRFASRDSRIEVYHIENSGVSVARNLAIEKAKGEYLCFVDSDDYLPNSAVMDLYVGIQRTQSDLCCGSWVKVGAKKNVRNLYQEQIVNIEDKAALATYMDVEEINGPVAKLYKLDSIKKAGLRYIPGILIGEDAIFNYQYMKECKVVSLIDKCVYYYNKLNAESVTHNFYEDYHECCLKCATEQAGNLISKKYPLQSTLVQKIFCSRFMSAINYILYYSLPKQKEQLKIRETCYIFRDYIDLENGRKEENEVTQKAFSIMGYFFEKKEADLYSYLEGMKVRKSDSPVSKIKREVVRLLGQIKQIMIYGR